jgi:hypothetical protein
MPRRPAPRTVHDPASLALVESAAPLRSATLEERRPAERLQEYRPTIREMPAGDRPRERLRMYGESALSNPELLAIILRVGIAGENVLDVAQRLLSEHGGLVGLARLSFDELCATRGLGEAKAAQLRAALELGRRLVTTTPEERPSIRSAQDVANLVQSEMALLDQEQGLRESAPHPRPFHRTPAAPECAEKWSYWRSYHT